MSRFQNLQTLPSRKVMKCAAHAIGSLQGEQPFAATKELHNRLTL